MFVKVLKYKRGKKASEPPLTAFCITLIELQRIHTNLK